LANIIFEAQVAIYGWLKGRCSESDKEKTF